MTLPPTPCALGKNGMGPESRQAGSAIRRPEGGDLTMTRSRSTSAGEVHMLVFCLGLVALIFAAVPLYLNGEKNIAWLVSNGGTLLWFLCWAVYIVFWHSRDRWPDKSPWKRYVRFITFMR